LNVHAEKLSQKFANGTKTFSMIFIGGCAKVLQTLMNFSCISILGTPLSVTNYQDLTKFLQRRASEKNSFSVDFSNTHVVTLRRHELAFRELTRQFDFFIPDGMPLIWCMNFCGAKLKDRVYGPTFMRHCVKNSPAPFTHYFLGGSEFCLAKLTDFFLRENPRVQIVGQYNGYFRAEEELKILDEINRLAPDFIWVGLGTPKQQQWINRYKNQISRGIILAVGFAFDVNAGTKPDAPLLMQKSGLTWLFRIISEPRRLAGRYLKYNFLFLLYLLSDGLRGRAFKKCLNLFE
jgi:N-acetylglucosaminyldiphosphoundecaprenol N-acetyl-beta-D-mannosaminyltransferase